MLASRLSRRQSLLWIVCLAAAAVAARNFEAGLSGDGPLYAEIARRIAVTGEWFRLDGGVPDFSPYAEHPHLGFWILSLPLHWLPAADWSARIIGHLCYVAFLWGFFLFLRRRHSEAVGVVAVLLLWAWHRFSNPFSNVFLDPMALLFGAGSVLALLTALERRSVVGGAGAGALLALCAATKGILVAGFLPALGVTFLLHARADRNDWRNLLGVATAFVGGAIAVAGAYWLLVRSSAVPEFLAIYWRRQFTDRFSHIWSLSRVFGSSFWPSLLKETYFTAPLLLLAFRGARQKERALDLALPLSLLATFGAMYIGGDRVGGQYWLTVMPWVAWLIALGVEPWARGAIRLVIPSAIFAVAGVLFVQYIPFEAHGMQPSQDERAVRQLSDRSGVTRLWMDEGPRYLDFIMSCRYSWYGRVTTAYVFKSEAVPAPDLESAYLLYWGDTPADRIEQVKRRGWCLIRSFPGEKGRSLFAQCGHPRIDPLSPDFSR